MTLENLGYTTELENYRIKNDLSNFKVARVITEHKERYVVKNETGAFEAELIGNLRFNSQDRSDFPAVGDWVAISEYDTNKALIHHVFKRNSKVERQAVGRHGQKQLIATNIDVGFIVQAVNRDFNINRLERYLTICNASNVAPIIILTKIDLISETELESILKEVSNRIQNTEIIPISNETNIGIEVLKSKIEKGKTYCLLGSSGVGKSTLLNSISGEGLMKTGAISESVDRGKHVTTHRELIVLESGGIIIDNPGMREIGITENSSGLELTFESILAVSDECRFSDCSHVHENGCAILDAIENSKIDKDSYDNYLKMEREKQFFESTTQDKKKKDKNLGKLIKSAQKNKKRNKY
ncbi:Small ribosomal subunit biogenesis GTPase RsgA [Polaribacter huanghezhanensis]|uniref:ribosome small subunit-dependent GTPase A n=1 Tax=Polaribacter huanghezhanensis TaxID=1354726 RepID=UPI002649DEB8|nr:ribosome small subunit-dependent GTPase A [Polaribacter huanghezhanensis]WKD85794.1 Small ribosomal subunit biogenesis GTPase RsgA [Polaribacter huanghezhanensis]